MGTEPTRSATVHVISDSLGDTACEMVLAAAGQFPEGSIRIARLPKVSDIGQVERYIAPCIASGEPIAVFYTIVDPGLRDNLAFTLQHLGVPSVDLLGSALNTISDLLGMDPAGTPGTIHRTDERYFHRIEAMEYFVEHDDGRGAVDLSDADIVLLGVSRTSKTPLSMYLAFQGYKVANIPLAHGMEPPSSIYAVDPMRLFGLLSTTDVIASIRDSRLGDDMTRAVASSYADPEAIAHELEEARALMKRLGCFVVRTDNKAIEESASEIIGRLEAVQEARAKRRNR
ncbi:pyruvate, water dikinase regulatory protein [Collinsella ihumii]|uniref:pyruvate, water dikinase regulatory protein n=1 Tax=Collinsella ihumii TaxID=1720204 RepID=UPI00082F6A5C|nr:pyruvate, water dikinase regulatory protein [Collinsella ihumii]